MYLLTQFNNGCNNCHNSIECDTKQPFYWWQSHRHCKHCHTVNSNLMQPKTFFVQTLFPTYFHWVASYIPLSFSMTFLSSSPTKCRSCRLHPLKPISTFQSSTFDLDLYRTLQWKTCKRKEQGLPCSGTQHPRPSRGDSENDWTNAWVHHWWAMEYGYNNLNSRVCLCPLLASHWMEPMGLWMCEPYTIIHWPL